MKIQTIKGEYNVKWQYVNIDGQRVTTCCDIYRDEILDGSSGYAVCSKDDNFCRATGRKIALTRALQNYPREFRREVWQAYHKRGQNGIRY